MVKLNVSYDFMDAIEDIKVISKDKKLGITKDILPHLAIELVKSEQERKRNEILEESLYRISESLNMPTWGMILSETIEKTAVDDVSLSNCINNIANSIYDFTIETPSNLTIKDGMIGRKVWVNYKKPTTYEVISGQGEFPVDYKEIKFEGELIGFRDHLALVMDDEEQIIKTAPLYSLKFGDVT